MIKYFCVPSKIVMKINKINGGIFPNPNYEKVKGMSLIPNF